MRKAALILALLLVKGSVAQTIVDVPTWAPDALHEAIAKASENSSGTASVLTVRIWGTGSLKTEGIEFLPGLVIECQGTGYYKPQLKLIDNATQDLLIYPDRLKLGGGGSGKVYQHHSVIRNCTLDGNGKNQSSTRNILQLYNGGFQNRIEGVHFKDANGFCIYAQRTALNVYILNSDFSGCALGSYFDYADMHAGILKIENGQVDNSGPFIIHTANRGGADGNVSMFHFEALQVEWQSGQPKQLFRWINDGIRRPVVLYQSITVVTWLNGGFSPQLDAIITEEGSGLPGVHNVQNVTARGAQIDAIFRSKITGEVGRGKRWSDDTLFQDSYTYGLNHDE